MYTLHNNPSFPYDKDFYNQNPQNFCCCQCLLYFNLLSLHCITMVVNSFINNREAEQPSEKIYTLSELAAFDGTNGKPAYTAVNGIVYDVSNSPSWGGGTHFGLYSGKDVSSAFKGCHSTDIVLAKLPKVGILEIK